MLEILKKDIGDNVIKDVYVVGFVDMEDDVVQFYHDLRFLYIEINSNFIVFESIEQFSKLRISMASFIENDFEIDEDMKKAKSSISEIVLNDTMSEGNNIESMIFYNLEDGKELICDAVEIKLVNGQIIFMDPSYYFGINIGGNDQKQMWKNNFNDNLLIKETHVKMIDE